jgi:hypothetical protein
MTVMLDAEQVAEINWQVAAHDDGEGYVAVVTDDG